MDVVRHVKELQHRADETRAAGRRIALVPTMGALHEGHLELVREARRKADVVWVTVFVNPTQFGPGEDLAAYPRTFDQDCSVCEREGVDLVFAPDPEEFYPEGCQTWIEVTELSQPLCGAARPTHFRGVSTIVPKLFLAAKPHIAVFGEKDFQQLSIIRRLTRDLCFDVEILGVPTVRESDGIAMSSRNRWLDPRRRAQAAVLYRALDTAELAVRGGVKDVALLNEIVAKELAVAADAQVDYAEFRDPETLELISGELRGPTLLALAVFFPVPGPTGPDQVRLIDNRVLPAGAAQNLSNVKSNASSNTRSTDK
ncbi:MAG: pantoate--beta-alanine ligase [Deltaproteobacteria bacterium]|nr:pantoate--beta-alanine ligase [Deltaproteobacteria bacterium]